MHRSFNQATSACIEASIRPPQHATNYSVLRGGQASIRPPLHAANYSIRPGFEASIRPPLHAANSIGHEEWPNPNQATHEGWPSSNQATNSLHPERWPGSNQMHAANRDLKGQWPECTPISNRVLRGGQAPIRPRSSGVQSNSPNQHVANSGGQRFQTTVWPKGWTILKFGTPLYSNQSTVCRGGNTDNLHMEH